MQRFPRWLAIFVAAIFILAPVIADAAPGGRSGGGIGSRGSRTHDSVPTTNTAPGGAQNIQRSQTAPGPTQAGAMRPGAGAGATQGGFFQRNPFLGGLLAGGMLGMLIGGGAGFLGEGFAGLIGVLLQVGLIALIVMVVLRLIRGRRQPTPAMAGGRPTPDAAYRMAETPLGGGAGGHAGSQAGQRSDTVGIVPGDYQAFEQLLQGVQAAWTARDRDAMTRMVTPEIFQFLTDEVVEDDRQGRHNKVEQVNLLQGDLAEAWSEGARDYASVAMRFRCVDYTIDRATGRVVEGSSTQAVDKVEIWTFVRPRGGAWVLSAIQQTR